MDNTHNRVTNKNNDNNVILPPPPTLESVDHASLDTANYATDYGEHAAISRTTTSATAPAVR
jgi:hypothetical protein